MRNVRMTLLFLSSMTFRKTGSNPSGRSPRACFSGSCSWPSPRTGNRQSVADVGQIIFEIAVFVGLRFERHAADLAVAGREAPADGAHAAPFGTIDRHGIQDPERRRQHLGADPLAGCL